MKLLASITTIIAAASARQILDHQTVEQYANSAELYQSAIEHQEQNYKPAQPHPFVAHEVPHEVLYQEKPSVEKAARIITYNSGNNQHGYEYAYETENGIKAQEIGQVGEHGITTNGAYSYTGDDGQIYTVQYTADEHGFRAQGPHIPTPPPIPEAILKSLEQNAKEEAAGIYDEGKYVEQPNKEYHTAQQPQYEEVAYQSADYHGTPIQVSGADLAYHGHH